MPSYASSSNEHSVYLRKTPSAVRPRLVIVTGQHGNEPLGVVIGSEIARRLKMAESAADAPFELHLFGAVNAWGLAHDSREMRSGHDMNRTWGGPFAPRDDLESAVWEAVLEVSENGDRVLVLDMHSHSKAEVFYVAGPDGAAVAAEHFAFLPCDASPAEGSLTCVAERNGIHCLTVEAQTGGSVDALVEALWEGIVQWARA